MNQAARAMPDRLQTGWDPDVRGDLSVPAGFSSTTRRIVSTSEVVDGVRSSTPTSIRPPVAALARPRAACCGGGLNMPIWDDEQDLPASQAQSISQRVRAGNALPILSNAAMLDLVLFGHDAFALLRRARGLSLCPPAGIAADRQLRPPHEPGQRHRLQDALPGLRQEPHLPRGAAAGRRRRHAGRGRQPGGPAGRLRLCPPARLPPLRPAARPTRCWCWPTCPSRPT